MLAGAGASPRGPLTTAGDVLGSGEARLAVYDLLSQMHKEGLIYYGHTLLRPEVTAERAASIVRDLFDMSPYPPLRLYPKGATQAVTEHITQGSRDEALIEFLRLALRGLREARV